MRRLNLDQFLAEQARFDEAVAVTPEIAHFCSTSLWQRAARECLRPPGPKDEHFIVEEDGNWLLFAERGGNRVFFPFEAAWMFGCPLAGDPEESVALLEAAAAKHFSGRVGFCLGGIRKEGLLHEALRRRRVKFRRYEEFPGTDLMMIDLSGGFEAWLERRSKKFRKAVRQIRIPEGVEIVPAGEASAEELFERLLAIQRRTYKWEEGTDIFLGDEYVPFYRTLLGELQKSGELRLLFAQRDGADLAYIFGGVKGDTYRGLQMSFVESERRSGLGNCLQIRNLQACVDEGISTYDLGMHSAYKERWADRREEFIGAFVVL